MTLEPLLQTLGTEYTLEILVATQHPKTADELSNELEIPIATCYRRLQDLQERDLIRAIEPSDATENRTATVYQRRVSNIRVSFEDGTVILS